MTYSKTLVGRLTRLQAGLQNLHTKFGEPQYQNVLLRIAINSNNYIDEFITPTPKVTNALTSNTGREVINKIVDHATANNIKVAENFVLIEEVIRNRPVEWFSENVLFYVVNPKKDEFNSLIYDSNNMPIGDYYKLAKLLDKDITTYTLILEQIKDHYSENLL